MNCSIFPIEEIIPQRPPIIMVDRMLSCDETEALAEFTVREDNIFLDDGMLSATGIMENMAQSCAARIGCYCLINNEPIRIGVIGEIRNGEIIRLPKCGETLHTKIRIKGKLFNVSLFEVSVFINEEIIAKAKIKVAMTDTIANLSDKDR